MGRKNIHFQVTDNLSLLPYKLPSEAYSRTVVENINAMLTTCMHLVAGIFTNPNKTSLTIRETAA